MLGDIDQLGAAVSSLHLRQDRLRRASDAGRVRRQPERLGHCRRCGRAWRCAGHYHRARSRRIGIGLRTRAGNSFQQGSAAAHGRCAEQHPPGVPTVVAAEARDMFQTDCTMLIIRAAWVWRASGCIAWTSSAPAGSADAITTPAVHRGQRSQPPRCPQARPTPAYQPPPPLLPAPRGLPQFEPDDACVRWKQGMIEAGVVDGAAEAEDQLAAPRIMSEPRWNVRNRAAEALAAIDSRVETALQAREWQSSGDPRCGRQCHRSGRVRGEIRQRAQHPRSVIDILPYDRSRSRV